MFAGFKKPLWIAARSGPMHKLVIVGGGIAGILAAAPSSTQRRCQCGRAPHRPKFRACLEAHAAHVRSRQAWRGSIVHRIGGRADSSLSMIATATVAIRSRRCGREPVADRSIELSFKSILRIRPCHTIPPLSPSARSLGSLPMSSTSEWATSAGCCLARRRRVARLLVGHSDL
jgi:hypothetical protein